ncbi:methyltransferase domain-containing protein [Acetobacter sp. TBRC 12305]|uniref:Methyltransferase domain-containing protein n=1 Tax=Acetobacter garciniae TaxID=2817435 RepID=A0A939HM56_9PROT|nr:methyltransferase domain-containing protein [Acetobacter garciniae]MBO1324108.1 methyltransferase domain-containing protein [Acetobacter garciniae]MBX0343797.1 methyltransferase domain-containing protein [Acetobacter garciniae]
MSTPLIFDPRAVRLHRDRAARRQGDVAPILQAATDSLIDRLDDMARPFATALDIGGRGLVCQALAQRGISAVALDVSPAQAALSGGPAICADLESLPFAARSFDLVTACLSLHWVNDLPGLFAQIRHVLRPDGLFLASVPILPTLGPLRKALEAAELAVSDGVSPRVSPLPTQQSCAQLMQRAGFALPVVDSEVLDLRYRTLWALMADLRAAGETNALALRPRTMAPRMLFPAAAAMLEETGEDSFAMPLHMAVLSGWAPAPTQPKPLAPGQFQHNLGEYFATDQ